MVIEWILMPRDLVPCFSHQNGNELEATRVLIISPNLCNQRHSR